jgi:hypothetical protein
MAQGLACMSPGQSPALQKENNTVITVFIVPFGGSVAS